MILYILKSSLYLIAFYAVYRIFLARQTFFQSNRVFLILALILSLLLPLAKINEKVSYKIDINQQRLNPVLSSVISQLEKPAVADQARSHTFYGNSKTSVDYKTVIIAAYGMVLSVLMLRFVWNLVSLLTVRFSSQTVDNGSYYLVLNNSVQSPFSFFKYIYLNPENLENPGNDEIVEHELAHVRQYHTLDILLYEIFSMIFWFNPFVRLLKHSLKEVHEYLADREVLKSKQKASDYKRVLLAHSSGNPGMILACNNDFNLLKKRLIMMSSRNSQRSALFRYLTVLPLILILFIVFSTQFIYASGKNDEPGSGSEQSLQDLALVDNNEEVKSEPGKYYAADDLDNTLVMVNMKEFKDNDEITMLFDLHVEHDEKGLENGKASVEYFVDEEGNVIDVKIISEEPEGKGVGTFVKELIKRIKYSPGIKEGKPVKVKMNMELILN